MHMLNYLKSKELDKTIVLQLILPWKLSFVFFEMSIVKLFEWTEVCIICPQEKIMWAIWTVWRSFHVLFEEVIKQKRTKYLVKEKIFCECVEKHIKNLSNLFISFATLPFYRFTCYALTSLQRWKSNSNRKTFADF